MNLLTQKVYPPLKSLPCARETPAPPLFPDLSEAQPIASSSSSSLTASLGGMLTDNQSESLQEINVPSGTPADLRRVSGQSVSQSVGHPLLPRIHSADCATQNRRHSRRDPDWKAYRAAIRCYDLL